MSEILSLKNSSPFVESRKIMGFKALTVLNNKKLSRSSFGSNFGLLSKNFRRKRLIWRICFANK